MHTYIHTYIHIPVIKQYGVAELNVSSKFLETQYNASLSIKLISTRVSEDITCSKKVDKCVAFVLLL